MTTERIIPRSVKQEATRFVRNHQKCIEIEVEFADGWKRLVLTDPEGWIITEGAEENDNGN